tara:strand:- start:1596 stop:2483 length:888 start_codon:yes stop_codon:yes gene_type:complete
MTLYCSPSITSTKTCFTLPELKLFVKQYNKHFPDKINLKRKLTINTLIHDLNLKLLPILGDNKQYLWPEYLSSLSPNSKLLDIASSSLMPKKPKSWNNNPDTWLNNFDIDAILNKFSNSPSYHYHYLGTKPIDFAVKSQSSCSYDSECRIDISDFIDRDIKYLGLVLNLDRHDQSGSHWVSVFFSIDPKSPSYGIYYYDSVSNSMPSIVTQYIKDIQKQLNKKYKKKLPFKTNHVQHQFGNNECGMFSICYQIRWLNLLKRKKQASFNDVIHVKINDKIMNHLRNILFRPNHDFS